MSELPRSAKYYADQFKTSRGIVDFYRFLGISRNASAEEITHAMMTKTSTIEGSMADYWKMTMLGIAQKHLGTPEARAVYDRKLTSTWRRLFDRADTKAKRIALLAFPFLTVITLYRWAQDLKHYEWEPSLSFFIFAMASAMCLLIAFTRLGDWINTPK